MSLIEERIFYKMETFQVDGTWTSCRISSLDEKHALDVLLERNEKFKTSSPTERVKITPIIVEVV